MRREYLDQIVTDWALEQGYCFNARAQAILVEELFEAMEAEIEGLRPVGGDERDVY